MLGQKRRPQATGAVLDRHDAKVHSILGLDADDNRSRPLAAWPNDLPRALQRRRSLVLVTRRQVQPDSLQTRTSPAPGAPYIAGVHADGKALQQKAIIEIVGQRARDIGEARHINRWHFFLRIFRLAPPPRPLVSRKEPEDHPARQRGGVRHQRSTSSVLVTRRQVQPVSLQTR